MDNLEKDEEGIMVRIWNAKSQWWNSVLVVSGLIAAVLATRKDIFASLLVIFWLVVATISAFLFLQIKKSYDLMQDNYLLSPEKIDKNKILEQVNIFYKCIKKLEKVFDYLTPIGLIVTLVYFIYILLPWASIAGFLGKVFFVWRVW